MRSGVKTSLYVSVCVRCAIRRRYPNTPEGSRTLSGSLTTFSHIDTKRGTTVRTKLISGVIAAFMLLPAAANAGEPATDCYLEPTAEVCTPEAPEDEHEAPSDVEEHEDEVLVASETALPDTGVDTWTILGLSLGLLALGGVTLARSRRQSDPTAG